MADRDFVIVVDIPKRSEFKHPSFLERNSTIKNMNTCKIASVRIQVERAIARIKAYKILNTVFPMSKKGMVDMVDMAELKKLWLICKLS